MTEAVIRVTDFAFEDLGFDHLVFTNAVGNQRSHEIKARTDAILMGMAPAAFVDPAYTEHEIWHLTKEHWSRWRGSPGQVKVEDPSGCDESSA